MGWLNRTDVNLFLIKFIFNLNGVFTLNFLEMAPSRMPFSSEVGFLKHHGQDVDSRRGLRWVVGMVENRHVFSY
jgi:hypothetical protein